VVIQQHDICRVKAAGVILTYDFLNSPTADFPGGFLIYKNTKGAFMKIKFFAVCVLLICGNAWGACGEIALLNGQLCIDAGGKYCNDGKCRACCVEDSGGSGTTACTGTSTQDTSQTFSNAMGSGYILKQVFRGSCKCMEL